MQRLITGLTLLMVLAIPAHAASNRHVLVNFAFDSDTVAGGEQAGLAQLAEAMQAEPGLNVTILAYADDSGSDHYNSHLSQRRARAVVETMVEEHGIALERFIYIGLGSSDPVADNATVEGRAQNRRAVAVVAQANKTCDGAKASADS